MAFTFTAVDVGLTSNDDTTADTIRDAFIKLNLAISEIMSELGVSTPGTGIPTVVKDVLTQTSAAGILTVLGAADASGVYTKIEVDGFFTALVNGANAARNTLSELSDAIDNHTHADATAAVAGFMSIIDKAKLDLMPDYGTWPASSIVYTPYASTNIPTVATTVQAAIDELADKAAPLVHVHAVATTTADGFMSAADKAKLDLIDATGAPADNTVSTVKIQDKAVTLAKIEDIGPNVILGQLDGTATPVAGPVQQIGLATLATALAPYLASTSTPLTTNTVA